MTEFVMEKYVAKYKIVFFSIFQEIFTIWVEVTFAILGNIIRV